MNALVENILKLAACATPGEKIRSKGKGRGLARGEGKGPIGIPAGEKVKDLDVKEVETAEGTEGELSKKTEKKAEAFMEGYLRK